MELVINIPEKFKEHYDMDRFEDSLKRVESDLKMQENGLVGILSGNYELELIEMLQKAFRDAVEVNQ